MSKVLQLLKGIGGNSRGNVVKLSAAFFLTLVLATGVYFTSYSEDLNKGLSENLIRLHVIANSDSPADQQLKLLVRDAVILYMKDQLKDSRDIENTKRVINSNISTIEEIARGIIAEQNKDYPVHAVVGKFPFPTKVYGDITLPAGNYQALRVVIGEGEGANWWCVLFPPLCFIDATHGTVPDSVKQDLRNVLTEEEYNIITSADDDKDIPIKIRFKVVEFFQDSKIKFAGMVSSVFK